jgi:hypothetical protein
MRLLLIFAASVAMLHAQVPAFEQWMADTAHAQLAARAQVIAGIHSVPAAEARKAQVRSVLAGLLGGLPTYTGPLNAQVTGTIDRGSFRIEKILFESMPGIRVAANLYVPQGRGSGPFPAILAQIGHFQESKAWEQLTASNLAIKGFVVIAFDPIGQGERLQGYNPATGTSFEGFGVPQHIIAGGQAALVGQSYARYEIFDAKRAIDYLLTRPEVDPTRIGATGCSGGGTLTTYVAALDDRIQVAAPACSTASMNAVVPGIGDSEQSWLNFIGSGLDQTDFVELFAPRPYLILSTSADEDVPLAASKAVYDEAKLWYQLYSVPNQVQWFVGPGYHGTPVEDRQALYSWMIQWLNGGVGDATEQAVTLLPDSSLQVTSGNYVGGSDLYTVIRATPSQRGSIPELVSFLNPFIQYTPQVTPAIYGASVDHATYTEQPFTFVPEPGITISAAFLIPKTANLKPAAIYFETAALNSTAALQLVQSGAVVLDIMPRALPRNDGYDYTGEWYPAESAWLIGRNLPCMRAKDLLQGADLLLARSDVAAGGITLYANGVHGIAALYAAAVDQRIGILVLDRTPYSFAPALNSAGNLDLHSALVPGYLLKWDISSLVSALGRRKVVWTNLTDWLGNVVSQQATTPRLTATVSGKGTLGSQYYIDLAFTNSGPGSALGTSITSLGLKALTGSGAITSATTLPVAVGDLGAGVTQTVRILLNLPAGVSRFSVTENGTLTNDVGAAMTFSIAQAVTR